MQNNLLLFVVADMFFFIGNQQRSHDHNMAAPMLGM